MNGFIESTLFFIIISVIYFAGRYYDILSSQNFDLYGLMESRPFSRDKHGFFNTQKNIIGSAGFYLLALIVFLIPSPVSGGAFLIIISLALYSFYAGYDNFKTKRENRQDQILFLRGLKNAASDVETAPWPLAGRIVTREGRTMYEMFRFVYSEKPDVMEATYEAQGKLITKSQQDESTWFPKGK